MNDRNGVSVQPIHGFRRGRTTVERVHQLLLVPSVDEKNNFRVISTTDQSTLFPKMPLKFELCASNWR